MRSLRFLLFVCLMCLSLSPAVQAESYVEKIKVLPFAKDQNIFLEKLHGGGGVFDPVSVQMKNQKGTVVAFAPVAPEVAIFCPSLATCVVFPHGMLNVFATGWRLDNTNIDYTVVESDALQYKERLRDDHADYKSYLTYDAIKTFRSDYMGDPQKRLGAKGFIPAEGFFWHLAGFFLVLLDSILIYPVIAALGWLAYVKRKVLMGVVGRMKKSRT